MALTPTVYRWDDPGAPDLNAIMPTSDDKRRLFFHTVIRACLVDGYGSKPAAGWAMQHEEITQGGCRFAIRNAIKTGSLLYEGGAFSGGAGTQLADTLWACSDVPNIDTPLNAWSREVKYELRGSGTYHKTGIYDASSIDAWVVVANENFAVLVTGRSAYEFNSNSVEFSDNYSTCVGFGVMNTATVGTVAGPLQGNFFIAGGGYGGYAGRDDYAGFGAQGFTSISDMVGNEKGVAHSVAVATPGIATASLLNAWLPRSIVFYQSGASSLSGSSTSYKELAAVVTGVHKLDMYPESRAVLTSFMLAKGFEYGVPVSISGTSWLIFKCDDYFVNAVSLDPEEWGL